MVSRIVVIMFFVFSLNINLVHAKPRGADVREHLLERLKKDSGNDVRIGRHKRSGMVRFLGTDPGKPIRHPLPPSRGKKHRSEIAARSFLDAYGQVFGIKDQAKDLKVMKKKEADRGRSFVRFQQRHNQVPVMAGELILQMDRHMDIVSAGGRTISDIAMDTTPALPADEAREIAVAVVSEWYEQDISSLESTEPELWIYNPTLLGLDEDQNYLVWRMTVKPADLTPMKELVLVNANSGDIALHFNQQETGLYRRIWDYDNDGTTWAQPGGGLVLEEGQNPSWIDDEVYDAYDYAEDTYNFYLFHHGRDSRDGQGMPVQAVAQFCFHPGSDADQRNGCPIRNAFGGDPMLFGNGWLTEDIFAHEYTHGVTASESNLFYYMQSGAINEAFSDIWGEFVDLTNVGGSDLYQDRWLIGEDIPTGAIRSMEDPPLYDQPDKMTSTHYYCFRGDNGGVHVNSGIANKAAYLMVDGGTFNGHTVEGIGITKTAKVFYEVQTNLLTSGSDYEDLHNALYQGCLGLVGTSGIALGDCRQVREATLAVEMDQSPVTCSVLEAPLCDTGAPSYMFFDDMEIAPTGKWDLTGVTGPDSKNYGWHYSREYASSGLQSLWGDSAGFTSEYSLSTVYFVLPPGKTSYLHFKHIYDFAAGDGGVLEYDDSGGVWINAASLFVNNGYPGSIEAGTSNPLAGKAGYSGHSHGYVSSRLDLTSLAGESVRFRFRIGNDNSGMGDEDRSFGWIIDDVGIYTCETNCSYNINPISRNISGMGGKGRVYVTTQHGCQWEAASNSTWISVPSGIRSGSQSIEYVIDENPDTTPRLGIIRVAGNPFQVLQAGKITLDEALDDPAEGFWSDTWFGQSDVSYYGGDAAQSGRIEDGQESRMNAVTTTDNIYISFYWKVSSEKDYDHLKLFIDGVAVAAISGEVDWQRRIVPLSGISVISFKYLKDGTGTEGADCGWVDKVEIGPCYTAIEPTAVFLPQTYQTGIINVTAPDDCSWLALPDDNSWLRITSSNFGTGNGTVQYSALAYAGDTPRTGTITIEDQTFTVTQWGHIPIGDAVDHPDLPWSIGGDGNWMGQPTIYFNDQDAAESGVLGDGETSWIETTVSGPVLGSCYWKVSSEPEHDYLEVLIDGSPLTGYLNGVPYSVRISGETDWDQVWLYVNEGTHTIRWVYRKDESGSAGSDRAWVDRVSFVLLDPLDALFGNAGGTGSVDITYMERSVWKAFSQNPWITITSAPTGTGNGSLTYTVDPNDETSERTGKIYIAGRDMVITQAGVPCTYGLTPQSAYLGPAGGTGTVNVTAPAGCAWVASPDVDWITVTEGENGDGNGTVNYTVGANGGTSERIGELEIGEVKFTVRQMGTTCLYTVTPAAIPTTSDGGTGSVNVETSPGCAWTAEVVDGYTSWISITSGSSGTGNGTVSYAISSNPVVYPRTGWMIIAKHVVPVNQEGIPCTFDLASNTATVPGEGGAGSVMVTSVLGCNWSAESNDSWITVTNGSAAGGSYLVTYDVAPNPGNTPRNGTITIAGQTYTVFQGGMPCDSYVVEPEGQSFPAEGGTGSLALTAPDGCPWNAAADSAWIIVTAGMSGVGKGTITYQVSANPGPTIRAGMITVEDQMVTVRQAGTAETLNLDLPRTGQETSYAPGDDGDDAVRAGIQWPEPRFTNPDGTTPVDEETVLDRLTGLNWTRNADTPGPGICAPATFKNWYEALDYVSCLNSNGYLGFYDWRLPSVVEMESLLHAGLSDVPSWLMSQGFTSVPYGIFWTATTSAANTDKTKVVDMWGYIDSDDKSDPFYSPRVWPVRGESSGPARLWRTGQTDSYMEGDDGDLREGVPWPMPRFADLGECIKDNLTGLVWLKNPDMVQRSWDDALAYANGLSVCSSDTWRLPNRKELLSLMNHGAYSTADWLNQEVFTGLLPEFYWSSTSAANETTKAWAAGMWLGDLSALPKDNDTGYVLPVCGGMINKPRVLAVPAYYDFGTVGVLGAHASQDFSFSNMGTGALFVDSLDLAGADAAAFSLAPGGVNPCPNAPFSLAPKEDCSMTVTFAPETTGLKNAVLQIISSDADHSPLDVMLSGEAVCTEDMDGDEDVDGLDLASLGEEPGLMGLGIFASIFGRASCYRDYTGTYCLTTENSSRVELEVSQSGENVTFTIMDQGGVIGQGTGTVNGKNMTMTGTTGGGFDLSILITFFNDGRTCLGTYEVQEDPPSQGGFTGAIGPCDWGPIPTGD